MFLEIQKEGIEKKVHEITGKSNKTLGDFYKEFRIWAEPVQRHKTFEANCLALRKLILATGETIRLDRITPKHVDDFISDCKRSGLMDSSINLYIRHMKSSMNKAVDWGYIKANPLRQIKQIKERQRIPRFIQKKEIAGFLAEIEDPDVKRIVYAYLVTGRRRSELLSLTWEDIDFKKNRYVVRSEISKSLRTYVYPINKAFRAILEVMLSEIDGAATGKIFTRWKRSDTVSKVIKKELRRQGLGDYRLHDLRHTFASLKAQEGLSLFQLKELLGHSQIKATMIYAHLTEDGLAEIAEVNIGPVDILKRS